MFARDCVAVVGMGATIPGALDVSTAWHNMLSRHCSVERVPTGIWDTDLFFDETGQDKRRVGTDLGAFVRGFQFSGQQFKMPPTAAAQLDPIHSVTLVTARQALADAGIDGPTDGIRASVILGNLQGGATRRGERWLQLSQPLMLETISTLPGFKALPAMAQRGMTEEFQAAWGDKFLPMTGESLCGVLGNIAAARVAHHFNLHGPTNVIDAACASGLAALESSVAQLLSGRVDLALTGGVDMTMDMPSYSAFFAMGALSSVGSFPFDQRASGFVMGEGAVFFVLKRLSDARAAGDRVYAVVRGVGSSSDGHGRSIFAPNPDGQVRAMRDAWTDAGLDPAGVGYIEAHGTATPLGDPTEVFAKREIFGGAKPGSIPMGSVKGNIGHLKGAAGAAGMLRAILALHHQVAPPQAGFENPNPRCELESSPMRVSGQPQELAGDGSLATVSAFGFGGINYHVVLEAADRAPRTNVSVPVQGIPDQAGTLPLGLAVIAAGARSRQQLEEVAKQIFQSDLSDVHSVARRWANQIAPKASPWRFALHATDEEAARKSLSALLAYLGGTGSAARLEALGISLREDEACFGADQVAFMFPGQGSQYVGMLGDLAEDYPVVRQTLQEADRIMEPILDKPLSEYVSPPEGTDPGAAFFALMQTEVLQPAMLTADEALRRLLCKVVIPKVVFGHSLGEYAACTAAGVLNFEDALRIVAARGDAMESVSLDDNGLMLGVNAPAEEVAAALEGLDDYVAVVNKNCPSQTIVGGSAAGVNAAKDKLSAAGRQCMVLPVSHAFHSEIVAPAAAPLRRALDRVEVKAASTPLLSNVTGDFYPTEDAQDPAEWARANLARQVASPVEFIRNVETAYQAGCRVFVEVGPKRALAGFVSDILKGRSHRALYLAHPKFGERVTLGRAVASLVADGVVPYGDAPATQAARGDVIPRFPALGNPEASRATLDALAQGTPAIAGSPGNEGAVISDPRFWQFLAMQGPALIQSLTASYQAALQLAQGQGTAPVVAPVPIVTPVLGTATVEQDLPMAQAAAADAPLADMASWVQQRVAHVTGYDVSELDLDADIEADLGIDSIRQIEIVLGIRDELGLEADDEFSVGDHPTLRALIEYLEGMVGRPGSIECAPVADDVAQDKPASSEDLAGWVLGHVAEVTGYGLDELDVDADIEADLGIDSIRQIEIVLGIRDRLGLDADDDFDVSQYSTLGQLISYLGQTVASGNEKTTDEVSLERPCFARRVGLAPAPQGPRVGSLGDTWILHPEGIESAHLQGLDGRLFEVGFDETQGDLAALGDAPDCVVDLRALSGAFTAEQGVKGVINLARALDDNPPARVVVATACGGTLGLNSALGLDLEHLAAHGAVSGAWKSVVREWEQQGLSETEVRIIDLPSEATSEDWRAFVDASLHRGPVEVGVCGGEVVTPVLVDDAGRNPVDLGADSVAVLVGGARGITAQVGALLARRYGCRLALVGRTPLRDDISGRFDTRAVRTIIRQERPKASSAQLTEAVEARRREHEVFDSVNALRQAGAKKVSYHRADASDPAQVAAALEAATHAHGRLDLVVHAAGLDRSRRFTEKEDAEVEAVLSTKLGGAATLVECAGDAKFVAFTSVSGRFGNAGQVDYAAANDGLAKLAAGHPGGLALDFSAWSDVGMAAPIAGAMRERGVDTLDPAAAAKATVDLIAGGATGEWVVAGRLGDVGGHPPLASKLLYHVPGAEVIRGVALTLEKAAWLRDHKVGDKGLLPGVLGIEAMAYAAASLEPELELAGFEDVLFHKPVRVCPGEALEVTVDAERTAVKDGSLRCQGAVRSDQIHHQCIVLLGTRQVPALEIGVLEGLSQGPARQDIYRKFFHGPSFQVVASSELCQDGACAVSEVIDGDIGADIPKGARSRAMVREFALQTAAIHGVFQRGVLALPVGCRRIRSVGQARGGASYQATARFVEDTGQELIYNVVVCCLGEVIEEFEGMRFRKLHG